MCGDGANDCGALKRAHTGISLSEAEASVASPFTSKVQNISCVLQVIKEGRCALVTSFNLFKFMALYSMIQYSSVLLLYSISSNLGDFQFLYIDLFIITSFALTMGRTGPTDFLSPQQPLDRLMHPNVLFSLIAQIFTQTGFQVLLFFYIKSLPNYYPIDHKLNNGKIVINSFENTILFTSTTFQYIIVALVFSPGFPYRKPFFYNKGLVTCSVVFIALNCMLLIKPCKFFMKILELKQIQDVAYYEVVFGLLFSNLLVSYIIDFFVVDSSCMRRCLKFLNGKGSNRKLYKRLMPEFSAEPSQNEYSDAVKT